MRPLRGPAARQAGRRLTAVALALVTATVAGCGTAGPEVAPPAPVAEGAAAATSSVAELQAGLTSLLVQRVYVVAAATPVLAGSEPESGRDALDAGSVALADVVGATYSAAREPLLKALRAHDRLLARRAVALPAGSDRQLEQELEAAQAEVATVLRQVVPTLDVAEVAGLLGSDARAQLAAGSPELLRAEAREAVHTARLLTAAIAADRGLGSAGTRALRLRAALTGLLTEHALLVGELGRSPASARAALDGNATELADLLAEPYPALRGGLLRSWMAHLDRLERYAAARVAGSEAVVEAGLVQGYPAELARLLAEHVRGLPAQSPETELVPALRTQLAAVDEAAADSTTTPQALAAAASAVLPAAALLSAAVAEDLRLS